MLVTFAVYQKCLIWELCLHILLKGVTAFISFIIRDLSRDNKKRLRVTDLHVYSVSFNAVYVAVCFVRSSGHLR